MRPRPCSRARCCSAAGAGRTTGTARGGGRRGGGRDRPEYVSRGGVKLANALDAFGLEVGGRHALDAGASTGGFTDCLLRRGCAHVVAVDVGYGELAWSLREDARVTVMGGRTRTSCARRPCPTRPDLLVADLSFISLTKVLPALLECAAERFDALLMVKPQFEVGRGRVGRGGVVREPELRREALLTVAETARSLGASVLGFASSGLPGPKGNQETFVWLGEGARAGVPDLEAAARAVEP